MTRTSHCTISYDDYSFIYLIDDKLKIKSFRKSSQNSVHHLFVLFRIRNVENFFEFIVKMISSLYIVLWMIPLYDNFFDPFPTNFHSTFYIILACSFFCFLGLGTETFDHGHELRNKICDSIRVLYHIFFYDIEFFKLRRRVLLMCYCLRSFISSGSPCSFHSFSIRGIFSIRWRLLVFLLVPHRVISFAFLFLVFSDFIL